MSSLDHSRIRRMKSSQSLVLDSHSVERDLLSTFRLPNEVSLSILLTN
jgi:hypothetical protein